MEYKIFRYRGTAVSFVSNNSNQLNFSDSVLNITERERKFLDKSWDLIKDCIRTY